MCCGSIFIRTSYYFSNLFDAGEGGPTKQFALGRVLALRAPRHRLYAKWMIQSTEKTEIKFTP